MSRLGNFAARWFNPNRVTEETIDEWITSANQGQNSNSDRNSEMKKMRDDGASLREIAKEFGVSQQRVHQVLGNGGKRRVPKVCAVCGNSFEASTKTAQMCDSCRAMTCEKCGEPLKSGTILKGGRRHGKCRDFIGASSRTTYRAVERGIYARFYQETLHQLPGFYVMNANTDKWVKFDTLAEAQKYRASDVWRKSRKKAVKSA